jgi:hypothetical protein
VPRLLASSKRTEVYKPLKPESGGDWRGDTLSTCTATRTVRFVIVSPDSGSGLSQKVMTEMVTAKITSADGSGTTELRPKTRVRTVDLLKSETAALCVAYRAKEAASLPDGTSPPQRKTLSQMTLLKSAATGDLGLRHELWEHVRAQKALSLEEIQAALAGLDRLAR